MRILILVVVVAAATHSVVRTPLFASNAYGERDYSAIVE